MLTQGREGTALLGGGREGFCGKGLLRWPDRLMGFCQEEQKRKDIPGSG